MGARILVVDDEEIVIKSYLRILGGGDYQVEAAHGGREALHKVEENPYDVIILDIMMPDMGGLEVLRRVKETHPDLDVIIVTGLAENDTVVEAKKLGAYDYISKPFELDELKLIVQRTLGRGSCCRHIAVRTATNDGPLPTPKRKSMSAAYKCRFIC